MDMTTNKADFRQFKPETPMKKEVEMVDSGPFYGETTNKCDLVPYEPTQIEYYHAPSYPHYSLPFKPKSKEY